MQKYGHWGLKFSCFVGFSRVSLLVRGMGFGLNGRGSYMRLRAARRLLIDGHCIVWAYLAQVGVIRLGHTKLFDNQKLQELCASR